MNEENSAFATAMQDRYVLERVLGQGGMATVYLALEVRHRRRIALKVLRPQLAETLGQGRFLREIEVTASLQHPHILPVFDSGETAGQLWYTMPYVEGMTLRDRMTREGQLPIPLVLRITYEIADALDYAHRHGVIHRDVKPENILLSDDHALLADLGIAKAVASSDTLLTSVGTSLGTPAYMPPEQIAGEFSDARSDQYALACVTYEMLTGEPPHFGKTIQAIAIKRLTEPPPSARRLRTTVSADIDAALTRAMAVAAVDRFPTTRAFAEALGAAPGATPATAAAIPARKTRRATMIGGVIAAIACLTLAGWAITKNGRSTTATSVRPDEGVAKVASPAAPPPATPPVADTVTPRAAAADSSASRTPLPPKEESRPKATGASSQASKSTPPRQGDSTQTARACARLLERITLGEELSAADSAFQRTRCR